MYAPPLISIPPKKKNRQIEKGIQKAIQQAFKLRHRITLAETNAGGLTDKKGVIYCPKHLRDLFGLPQEMPFGCEAWLGLPKGFPDLSGQIRPRVGLFVEVKKPGERPRPEQLSTLEALRADGHVAFWADSVDSALAQFEEQVAA